MYTHTQELQAMFLRNMYRSIYRKNVLSYFGSHGCVYHIYLCICHPGHSFMEIEIYT